MGQLYKITFKTSKKSYIGISRTSAEKRWKKHNTPSNKSLLSRAIKKYGKDDAVITVLADGYEWNDLCLMERRAIIEHKTKAPNGYNVTDGGEGTCGVKISEKQKSTISAVHKGYPKSPEHRAKLSAANLGKKLPFEQIEKMSLSQKGRKHSKETKEKMSISMTGISHGPISELQKKIISEENKGKVLSKETKSKISASNKGRHVSPEAKNNMSASHRGNTASEETRKKMSESHKKIWALRKL